MEQMKLKRKIYDELLEWKKRSDGKSAVLIEGARRVGKSTLVRTFVENEYMSYIWIDFGVAPKEIRDLFSNERDNLAHIFEVIQTYYKVELVARKSAIVFDEVQRCPEARSLIKYLVANGKYDYIETGSLISLKKNVQDIIIPSEEEKLCMFPLDFEEFLWAMGDTMTVPMLRRCYEQKTPVGEIHRRVMGDFRRYLLVGGMPQAVVAYVTAKDDEGFSRADIEKKNILTLYSEDAHKYADGKDEKALAILEGVPGQLSKTNKRFMLSTISATARSRSYEEAFNWLRESMIVNICVNVTDPSVGLALTEEATAIKCYLGDTGLLVTQTFRNKAYLDNELYRSILLDKLDVNEGMIMENYVAQALRARGYSLYFYAKSDSARRENEMEIDFIISQDDKLNPIEVKSGDRLTHVSLDKFKKKFGKKVDKRYVLSTKDLRVDGDVVYLPLYMAMFL